VADLLARVWLLGPKWVGPNLLLASGAERAELLYPSTEPSAVAAAVGSLSSLWDLPPQRVVHLVGSVQCMLAVCLAPGMRGSMHS
jgi:hypothetical protein